MKFFRIVWMPWALILISSCSTPQVSPKTTVLRGAAMGTTWKIVISDCPEGFEVIEWQRRIEERVEDLESQMSHWRDDSLLSKINDCDSAGSHETTIDMDRVLNEARRVSKLADGAFDVTAAPIVDLWGFGASGRRTESPTDDEIQSALARVGSANFDIEERGYSPSLLWVRKPGTRFDVSALAKGYAIDCVAEMLLASGVRNFLMEFGGELRASGVNSEGVVWRVGLESPTAQAASTARVRSVVVLKDVAVATSGTYRNFVEGGDDGKRLSHITDPRTGRPIAHDLISVSVIDRSAMRADAWATALMVLGPRDGFRLAESSGMAATFVVEGDIAEKSTVAFSQYVSRVVGQ